MWGIVLVFVALAGVTMSIISMYRQAVALRQAGYAMFSRRPPLSELPRPVRRRLQRAILRGEPVPAELVANARNWANYIVALVARGWRYLWFVLAVVPLLLLNAWSTDPLSAAVFWGLIGCVGVLVISGLLLWQYQRAARRLLRDTAPPA